MNHPVLSIFFAREHTRTRWLAVFCLAGAGLVGVAPHLHGQVFRVGAGSSSQFQAHGGSVDVRAARYEGGVGIGTMEGLRIGAHVRTRYRGSVLSAGDETISFRMPTDVFDGSHYFLGRGLGVTGARDQTTFFVFAGASSVGLGTPLFPAARADRGLGVIFLDHRVNPNLRFFSRNVFSNRQTSVHGFEWQPRPGVRGAVSGGTGADSGYGATSLTADKEWISIKASYVRAGHQFRRIAIRTPLNAETDRENVQITLHPTPYFSLTAGRQNYLQPVDPSRGTLRGTVNQFGAVWSVRRFTASGTLYDSHVPGGGNRGTSISLGRDLFGRLQFGGSFLRSQPTKGPATNTWLGTFRQTLSPRLSLLEQVSHSNGQTSVAYGGNFLSNRFSVGVNYQTIYVPFRSGSQFRQALVLTIGLQPFGNFRLGGGTLVAPDGSIKYTAQIGTFLYGNGVNGAPGPPAAGITLHRYLVAGRVLDPEGRPVRGAALRVDGAAVFTDSEGKFFVRRKKRATIPLEILLDQFLAPGRFELVSAPATVSPAPDDSVQEITIIVRRVPTVKK